MRKKLHEIQQGQTDVANSDCAFMGKTAQKNTWISDDYYISLQSELMILFLVCAECGWPSFGVLANTKAHQVFEGESVIAVETVNKGTNWQLVARKGHKQGKTVRHNGVEVVHEERLLAFSWSYGCRRRVLSGRVMGRQNSPLGISPFALAFLNR